MENMFYVFFFGYLILVIVFVFFAFRRYDKIISLHRQMNRELRQQLEKTLNRLMAVDYEKLAEVDMRARAEALAVWHTAAATNEYSDLDIQEPYEVKVRKDAITSTED